MGATVSAASTTDLRGASRRVRPRSPATPHCNTGQRRGRPAAPGGREPVPPSPTRSWTTCSPQDPDWYIRARELELDLLTTRERFLARHSIVFMDTPIFWMPWAEFPLSRQRQSACCRPLGLVEQDRVDFPPSPTIEHRAQLRRHPGATHHDPRRPVRQRRIPPFGRGPPGTTRLGCRNDKVTGEERRLGSIQHQHASRPTSTARRTCAVSDDAYFRGPVPNTAWPRGSTCCARGGWIYAGGWWTASALAQRYQTLNPDPGCTERRALPPPAAVAWTPRADLAGGMAGLLRDRVRPFRPSRGTATRPRASSPTLSSPDSGARPGSDAQGGRALHQLRHRPCVPATAGSPIRSHARSRSSCSTPACSSSASRTISQGLPADAEPRLFYLRVPSRDQTTSPLRQQPFRMSASRRSSPRTGIRAATASATPTTSPRRSPRASSMPRTGVERAR